MKIILDTGKVRHQDMGGAGLIACHECDLVQEDVTVSAGGQACCRRCGYVMYRHPDKTFDTPIAWSVAGLILLLLANVYPVLSLSVSGHHTSTTLISGAVALSRAGQFGVAALVIGILIVAPALLFLLQIAVLQPLRSGRLVPHFVSMLRLLSRLKHWLMFDVFLLAVIVAVVKLSQLASVSAGAGTWAFAALMLASILSMISYDTHSLWDRYTVLTGNGRAENRPSALPDRHTALSHGLLSCHLCGLLTAQAGEAEHQHCPRCDSPLHARKTDSLTRTWALLIAGYVLFIPANVLPITITSSLFGTQSDTIMSGVAYFWHEKAYDLAIVIFTASVFVPLAKLLALTFLAFTVQRRTTWEPMQRTRLYRMVEFVGKWSMLDIFVVALLAQLVQFSSLASIEPGPGAIAFAAVVLVTMFAAMSFDSRLIWDPLEHTHDSGEQLG